MIDEEKQIRKEILDRWDSLGFTDGLRGTIKKNIEELFKSEAKELEKIDEEEPVALPIVSSIHFEKEVDKYIKEHLDELCDGLKIKGICQEQKDRE